MSRKSLVKQDSSSSLKRSSTKGVMKKQKSNFFSLMSKTLKKQEDEEEEINFLEKSDDTNCVRILIYMMINYEGMEQYLKKQSILMPINTYAAKKQFPLDISVLRIELQYFFQVITIRDFHDFYVDFYATFDKNKNFSLEHHEFKHLLEGAMSKCVGAKKFKVFTDLMLIDKSQYDNELNQKIILEIIDNFKDVKNESKIDYGLLFPYIISFFLEHTYNQIVFRKGRLDLMKGTEMIKGKEVEIKNITSIVTILKEMGIDYLRDKHARCLSYRDIENVLIKLKNIQKWITFDIIKTIIDQLAKIMQVDPKTQNEGKQLKLYKIVNFLALKLCIHQNCLHLSKTDKNKSKPASAYLEVLVLWNSAMFCSQMKQERLNQSFEKFINKYFKDQVQTTRPQALKALELFFKKQFALMPKESIKSILEQHSSIKGRVIATTIEIESLKTELYTMMCQSGFKKISEYIRISHEGITKQQNDQNSNYQNRGKDIYSDEQIFIQSPSSDKQFASPHDILRQTQQFQQQQQQQKIEQNNQKQIQNSQHSDDSEEDKEKGNKPLNKFKKAVKIINSEQAFVSGVNQKKDALTACFIMDSFLKRQNQIYQKILQSKINQQSQLINSNSQLQEGVTNQEIPSTPSEIDVKLKQSQKEQEVKQRNKKVNSHEENHQEFEQNQENLMLKKQQTQKQEIVIKDVKNYQDQHHHLKSNDLMIVAGKLGSNYGPNNFKNAYYHDQKTMSKTLIGDNNNNPALFQLTDAEFKDEVGIFQVVIDDAQLQNQLLVQQKNTKQKLPKDRSTCYCTIM